MKPAFKFYAAVAVRSLLVALAVMPLQAHATEETTDPYQDNLLGDVGGYRGMLSAHGVDVGVEYKGDTWGVVSGGLNKGTSYNDNLDIKFALDGEKLAGISGNKAMVYFINNFGGHPNATRVGSVQGIDNIETGTDTFKLYELWDEQSFLNDRVSVMFGLHDLNSEFDLTDMTANFIKPTMQIGQAFAQSGVNGPSVFPTTSLAGRVKVAPTRESYVSVAAFDGVPGDPNDARGTHVQLHSRDGLLLVGEAGLTPNNPEDAETVMNKIAIGGWTYTRKGDDLVDVDIAGNPIPKRMDGAYLLSSYQFYTNKDAGRDLGAYFRIGVADGNTAQVKWDYETGLVGHGWVPTRPDSEIGLGLSQSRNSDKYMTLVSGQADRSETGFELYYRDQLLPGLSLQPDVQYITNPGTDRTTGDATIVGLRLDVNF